MFIKTILRNFKVTHCTLIHFAATAEYIPLRGVKDLVRLLESSDTINSTRGCNADAILKLSQQKILEQV